MVVGEGQVMEGGCPGNVWAVDEHDSVIQMCELGAVGLAPGNPSINW